jgi:hypothetical protein
MSKAARSVWYSGFDAMAEGSCFFEDIIEAEQRLKGELLFPKYYQDRAKAEGSCFFEEIIDRGRAKAVRSCFFEDISRPSKRLWGVELSK